MTYKTKMALMVAILVWASAFVGIRAGLHDYSPEGLALLRYLVASACMAVVYYYLPQRSLMPIYDRLGLMALGAVSIGIYNITLNYGELAISSGMASFITSQSPIITTIFAVAFLGERIRFIHILGFMVSGFGIALIAAGEIGDFKWDSSLAYILVATFSGSCYSIFQKPFLKRYSLIEATAYVIWGGTLFLSYYSSQLQHDMAHASFHTTLTVIYLGIFPAAIGYIAWGYVLSQMPASRASSFLYFMPFIATLLGWLCLGEVPALLSLGGGLLAIAGIWLTNKSYQSLKTSSSSPALATEANK